MAGALREGLSLEDFLRAALSLPFHIVPGVALVHVRLGGLCRRLVSRVPRMGMPRGDEPAVWERLVARREHTLSAKFAALRGGGVSFPWGMGHKGILMLYVFLLRNLKVC